MPEAEDVILEAAERASHRVRKVWERRRSTASGDEPVPSPALQRRLATWQGAWLGRSWPVGAAAPRPLPGVLSRWARRLPPWTAERRSAAFADGRRIWLPRAWLEGTPGEPAADPETTLLTTLGLARRLARDRARPASTAGADPLLARELYWLVEGALGDAALARAWPGLAPALEALRRDTVATRPASGRLRPVEVRVEAWLRELLSQPADGPERALGGLSPDSPPAAVAAFASRLAAAFASDGPRYRAGAPIAHWGVEHPVAAEAAEPVAAAGAQGRAPRRGARLPRPLVRRSPEPGDGERPGPFVLPFGDPHLTVDDPAGLLRPPDRGHDEDPEILAAELAQLESLPVVRHDAPVRETLEDGGAAGAGRPRGWSPDTGGEPVWLYPEWDAARGAYRDPGCRVRELAASCDDGGWAESALARRQHLLARLRRELEGLRPRRQRLRRQPEGDELDLSGWVDDWADLRAQRAPAGRIYSVERPRRRDVAVSLLLDASGSTESWISGGQRVIDVVKEAALAFSEALATLGDRFALLAFSGQGASDVRLRTLKRFSEPPSPGIQRRIGALEPDAFTRLGGALRHATSQIAREHARIRLLLVLSDGKPQDEDGYEGSYGVEDVRQAVAEARLQGVRVFGVTVDREGAAYLPRLFGPHGYTLIWNAEALPDRLPAVYRRLTAGA